MHPYTQITELLLLAIPIAFMTWMATRSALFSEPRAYLIGKSLTENDFLKRKFFHLLTCEYCFSNYITAVILFLTGYKFIVSDWRGYFVAAFSLVWLSKLYLMLFTIIRYELTTKSTATLHTKK